MSTLATRIGHLQYILEHAHEFRLTEGVIQAQRQRLAQLQDQLKRAQPPGCHCGKGETRPEQHTPHGTLDATYCQCHQQVFVTSVSYQ